MNNFDCFFSINNINNAEEKMKNEKENAIPQKQQKDQFISDYKKNTYTDRIVIIHKRNIELTSKYQQKNENDSFFSNQSHSKYDDCETLFQNTDNLNYQEQNELNPEYFSQIDQFRQIDFELGQFITIGNLPNIINQINYQQNKEQLNSEYLYQSDSNNSISDCCQDQFMINNRLNKSYHNYDRKYIQIQYTNKSIISFSQMNDKKNNEENNFRSNLNEPKKVSSVKSIRDYPSQKMQANIAFRILSKVGKQEIEEEEENSQLVFKHVSIHQNSILKLAFVYIDNNYILIAKFSNTEQNKDDILFLDLLDYYKQKYIENSDEILVTQRIEGQVLKYLIIYKNKQQNNSLKE